MAQLRRDYQSFADRETVIVVVGPEPQKLFVDYWTNHQLPFIGLPDPEHRVLKLYGQEIKLLKLGRMPAQVIIDKTGKIRFAHYGHSMSDIPANAELVEILDKINQEHN